MPRRGWLSKSKYSDCTQVGRLKSGRQNLCRSTVARTVAEAAEPSLSPLLVHAPRQYCVYTVHCRNGHSTTGLGILETPKRDVGPHANEVKVAILIPALHAHVDVVRYSGHTCVAVVRARFGAQRRRC